MQDRDRLEDETARASDGVRARCGRCFEKLCRLILVICGKRRGGAPCVYVPERIINRPDPCIYSQFLLMQLQQPVTWDNPDVALFLGGIEQYTYDLTVDTEYDVAVTVHNASRDKPAIGTQVAIRWIEFGAGAQIRHPVATLVANVPVWPATTQVVTKWTTPATPGHYCIEVELAHPDDGNTTNNLGWNNTEVKAAASEVQVPVRIINQWIAGPPPPEPAPRPRKWSTLVLVWGLAGLALGLLAGYLWRDNLPWWRYPFWAVVGYLAGFFAGFAIRGRPIPQGDDPHRPQRVPWNLVEILFDSYVFVDQVGKNADPEVMFAPRPPAWPAHVEPQTFHFAPNETYRDVLLVVDAPGAPGPAEVFNVSALQGGAPIGGVTVTVTRG